MAVYDIAVESDESYWAQGFCNHNSQPNLQNIPKPVKKKIARGPNKGEWRTTSPGLRDIYVAHTPGDWIVCADYDQLELRIVALLANDEPLIKVFQRGEDPHAVNAASMFGYDNPADVGKAERDVAKVWIYQFIYGGGEEAIWKHVSVDFPSYTLKQSYKNRESFDKDHPAFGLWHDQAFKKALKEKSITAPLSGHRLEFYGRVEAAKVYNYPAQHTAADILNPAIPKVAKALDWEREFILGQIHDELVCCGPDPVKLGKLLIEKLETVVTINGKTLPFTAGVKMGPSYGEVEEVKKGESLAAGARRISAQYKERFAFLKRWGRALTTQPCVSAIDVKNSNSGGGDEN